MKEELNGLMSRGAFKQVKVQSKPIDANILVARFVLTIRNVVTEEGKYKERYVVQGHNDREKGDHPKLPYFETYIY